MGAVSLDRVLETLPKGLPAPIACFLIARAARAIETEIATPERIAIAEDGTISIREGARDRSALSYRAPEGGLASPRAAVFALGALLYEAITGRALFARANDGETRRAIANDPPPALAGRVKDASPELDLILARALAKHPAQRFASTRELAERLERYLADELHHVGEDELLATIDLSSRAARKQKSFAPPDDLVRVGEPKLSIPRDAPPLSSPPAKKLSSAPPAKAASATFRPPKKDPAPPPRNEFEDAVLDFTPARARISRPVEASFDQDVVRTGDVAYEAARAPSKSAPARLDIDEGVLRKERSRTAAGVRISERAGPSGPNWIVHIVALLVILFALALLYQFLLRPLLF
jgi:hypothetical protein